MADSTSIFPKVDPMTLISRRERFQDWPPGECTISAPRRAGGPGADDDTPGMGTKSPGRAPVTQTDRGYVANMQGAAFRIKTTISGGADDPGAGPPWSGGRTVRGPSRRAHAVARDADRTGRVYRTGPADVAM